MRLTFKITLLFTIMALLLSSCVSTGDRRGVSSSLVDYLYPNGQIPPQYTETTPQLRLPLKVGLAFVPTQDYSPFALSAVKKMQLLEEVRGKFSGLKYVKEITIIPETYLQSSKGFGGVEQIARLYNLDIVALVSYDQIAVTLQTKSSILYWTIIGAYFIKGNKNQASTFVDTAVFDVRSKKMLFRAPGVSNIQQSSTLVDQKQNSTDVRTKGFESAMADMTNNLSKELREFKTRIKEDKSVTITHSEGYGGGGGIQWQYLLLLLLGLLVLRIKKH